MKFKIWPIIALAVVSFTCSGGGGSFNTQPIQLLYDFGNESVCNAPVEQQCFSSPEEYGIYMAAQAEGSILKTVQIEPRMEKEIGEEFHRTSGFTFVEDRRTEKLREMLKKMKPHVMRKDVNYQVYLIKNDEINAWTVPGGGIYFTTGIYDFAKSEHELANILGHEIGHNECKHTHKVLQRLALAKMPFQMFGFDADAEFFVGLYSTAVVAFGQHQEMEADRNGFHLSAQIGYDPKIGLDFWKRLAKNENRNILESLFRSHPYSAARYQCGNDYIDQHKISK